MDLKFENIFLMLSLYFENVMYCVLVDYMICLIDFGSTTFVERYYSVVVST